MKTGINTGILTNAYPLLTEQIRELEKRALEEQKAFAYLDENSQLCFALPGGVDSIKDLAWNNVYELHSEEGTFTKKVYIKTGLDTYTHTVTLTKESINDTWQDSSSDQPVVMRAAGLYETGTDTMTASWEQLIADGIMIVNNGEVGVGTKPFVLPEKNEYGFYYGVPYTDRTYVYTFYADGSFVEHYYGSINNYPAGSATYSEKSISITDWNFTLSVVNDGKALDDGYRLYELGNQKYSIVGDLVLPNDNSVTAISKSAFIGQSSLTGIIIPDSVASISEDAFNECNGLISITCPAIALPRIPKYNLTTATITSGDIPSYGLSYANSLTSVTIGDNVTSIGENAFSSCWNLANITIGNRVTSIGNGAFYGAGFTNVRIPESVTSIGDNAFSNCINLTEIVIPDSVVEIGTNAFYSCANLAEVKVNENNKNYKDIDGNLYSKDGKTLIQYAVGKQDAIFAIPNDVTTIGTYAFYQCNLTNITIPNSVTSINDYAFYSSSLTEIIIPDNVVEVGQSICSNCYNLTKITCPASVLSNLYADNTETIIITSGDNIPEGALAWYYNLINVTIPSSVTSIGYQAFYNCNNLKDIIIPDSVISIGSEAFFNCSNLASVTVGKGVTSIGEYAFENCDNLTDIYYKGTEKQWNTISIDESTNYYLTNATIHYNYRPEVPDAPINPPVVRTAAGLYETGTNNLITPWEDLVAEGAIVVNNGGVSVGTTGDVALPDPNEYGFYYGVMYSIQMNGMLCGLLLNEDGSIEMYTDGILDGTLPAGSAIYNDHSVDLTAMGFGVCPVSDNGTAITLEGMGDFILSPQGDPYVITGDLVLPSDESISYVASFRSQNLLTGITLSDSVVSIGDNAFEGCEGLATITIPNIVSYIGYNAFYGCNSLQDVYYKGTEAEWYTINVDPTNEPLNNATIYYEGSPVPTIGAAGLYATGSNYKVLKTSWSELLAEGVIVVNDGAISVGTKLPDELPEKNEHGFYFGVPYYDSYGWGYVFYEDGSFAECEQGYEPYYYPTGSATYSNNKIYISEWDWSLDVTNNGCAIADMADGGYSYGLGEKHSVAGDLVLPNDNSIIAISDNAFVKQYSLTGITIPNTVTSIGDYAFGDCYNLVKLNYMGTIDQWAEIEFVGYGSNPLMNGSRFYIDNNLVTTVNLTKASKLSDNAFNSCRSLTEATVGDSVASIGSGAFSYCKGLSSVVISDGVTSINSSAFGYCENLKSITIPNSVTYIGDQAFIKCTNLQNIYYLGTTAQWRAITFGSGWSSEVKAVIVCSDGKITDLCSSNGLSYSISGSQCAVAGIGSCTDTDIIIPSTYNNYAVTSIASSAFSNNNNITSVTIPGSVTDIGSKAFYYCSNLANVELSNGIKTINSSAFNGCAMTSIEIPDSVTSIGNSAFSSCDLTSIKLGAGLVTLGDSVFDYNYNLTEIIISEDNAVYQSIDGSLYSKDGTQLIKCIPGTKTYFTVPNGVVHIGASAFANYNNLTNIVLCDTITTIGDSAFSYCRGLANLTMSNNITTIGRYAFRGCEQLTSISLPATIVSINDFAFDMCNRLSRVDYAGTIDQWTQIEFGGMGTTNPVEYAKHLYVNGELVTNIELTTSSIPDDAFRGISDLIKVVLTDNVTSIGEYVFGGCSKLMSVTLPSNLTKVPSGMFWNCESLCTIKIPDKVTIIDNSAFRMCSGLASIVIPSTLTKIAYHAFEACTSLLDIYFKGTEEQWNSISIDASNNTYFKNATIHYNYQDTETPDVELPADEAAGLYATGTDLLITPWQTLVANGTVNVIDGVMFTNYDSKTSRNNSADALAGDLVLPNNGSIKYFSGDTFASCNKLTSVKIPSSIKIIASGAFKNCSALTAVEIPDSVLIINSEAFTSCGLTSAVLPEGLKTIGSSAFARCGKLTSINIPESVTTIGSYAFEYCRILTNIVIPNNVDIGTGAFSNCETITEIVIPDGITKLSNNLFSSCSKLASVVIPISVTSIGRSVFYYCNKLADVYYKGTEAQWQQITIESLNTPLNNVTIHYNYQG